MNGGWGDFASDESDDRELVSKFVGGDQSAFDTIVRRHEARLTRVAQRYARSEQDAEDILQEAMLSAALALDRFRSESQLSTWLYRIVMNTGWDFAHRPSRREQPVLDDDTGGRAYHEILDSGIDYIGDHEMTLMITQALEKLTDEQREAIILVDVIGHSVNDVAKRQGVRPGTIKSRRSRARSILQAELADLVNRKAAKALENNEDTDDDPAPETEPSDE